MSYCPDTSYLFFLPVAPKPSMCFNCLPLLLACPQQYSPSAHVQRL
jgi:hypothetical protein